MAQYSEGSIVIECSLDTKELLENSNKAKSELVRLGNSGSGAAKGLDKIDKSAQGAGDSLGKLTTVAKAVSAALLSSKIIAYAESWNELEDRIQNTGATASQTKDILNKLTTTSNRNGRKINETAELYIRLSNSMKEAGYSTQGTLSYIDTLSNLMTINKTNSLSAESAINALTKAQMKGKLAGQEAMTVFSAMPSILKTLGTQLNKTEQEVRKMATDGKLSMKDFNQAMIDSQAETAALADNMRNNLGDATNHFTNRLKQALGQLDSTTGATQTLVSGIKLLAENMNVVVGSAGVLAAILAGQYLSSLTAVTKAKISSALASTNEAKAEIVLAQAELKRIAVEKEGVILAQKSLTAQVALAQTEKTRLAIRNQLKANSAQLIALDKAEIATKNALATATTKANTAVKILKGSLNLLGGPAGILLIAAGALMVWASHAAEAKKSALELTDEIAALTEKFKGMSKVQREVFATDLKAKIMSQTDAIQKQEDKIENLIEKQKLVSQGYGKKYGNNEAERIAAIQKEIESEEKLLAVMNEGRNKAMDLLDEVIVTNYEAVESTDKVTESTKKLNNTLSETAQTDIEKKIADLSTQLEIATLKQGGLNKEAYVYQAVLSALGDDAKTYQSAIYKAAQNGNLFKGSIEGLPDSVQPLIVKLAELWEVTGKGNTSVSNAEESIKQLSTELQIAKYEAQGLIDKANELKAIQALGLDPNNSNQISSNATQIEQMQKLIEQQNQLNLAKQGLDVAKQEIDSRLSPTEQIEQELKDKQTLIDAAYEQGLLSEQIYNDSILAAKQNAADKQKEIDDDLLAEKLANNQSLLSASSDLFGGLADLTKTFSNKQSAAYKAMFAVSKGFAIANATLSVASAAVKVLDDPTAVTPAQKFANYAAVAAAGGSLVSQLSSLSYGGGREHGGQVNANSMYRVGEGNKPEILQSGGRQYMIPGEAGKVISNKDINSNSTQSAPIINWSINVIGGDANNTSVNIDKDKNEINIMLNAVAGDIRDKGKIYNALKETTNVKSRL